MSEETATEKPAAEEPAAEEPAAEETADDLESEPEPELDLGPYQCQETEARGERAIHPTRENWADTAQALLDDGWTMCIDLTVVDYLTYSAVRDLPGGVKPERFEVVAAFMSHGTGQRLRARIQVPVDDPSIATLTSVYPGADYMEREAYDMFGITFEGHPDMSRILMPENWEGHPLRKDYDVGAIPVQFKGPQGG